jgi:hypothetical protein
MFLQQPFWEPAIENCRLLGAQRFCRRLLISAALSRNWPRRLTRLRLLHPKWVVSLAKLQVGWKKPAEDFSA